MHIFRQDPGTVERVGKNDAAVEDFERAAKLDPKLSISVDTMGIMESQMHDDQQSLKLFESAGAKHPNDPPLQYLYAEQLAEKSGQASHDGLTGAIRAASVSLRIDPSYQPARDLLARLYVMAGKKPLAIEQAKIALAHSPNDEVALYQEIMAVRGPGHEHEVHRLTSSLKRPAKSIAVMMDLGAVPIAGRPEPLMPPCELLVDVEAAAWQWLRVSLGEITPRLRRSGAPFFEA